MRLGETYNARVPWDELSDEQREIRELVRELARERIAPRAAEIDASHEFPWDVVELFREHEIFGLLFDDEWGGTGTGTLLALITIEEVSKVCATSGLLLAVQELGSLGLKLAGTQEQRERYLARLASGEWLCAYALTEAGSGSDSAAMRTTARLDGRRLRPERLEAVHHERRGRAALHRVRQDRPGRRPRRHLRVRRRSRHARVRGDAARAEDGDQRLDHGRARLRRGARAGGEPPRRGGRRVPDRDAHPRPLAPRRRGAGARHRTGCDRLRARVREDARDDGPADRAAPAHPGEARGHGDGVRGARGGLYRSGAWPTRAWTGRS